MALTFTRRGFALSGLAALGACGNGVGSSGAAQIDARVDATLNEMYSKFPNTANLASKADGLLVMPLVTDAAFGVGGSYGRGALRVGDVSVDYYSLIRGTTGLQFGVQQFAHVLFFMTPEALSEFRSSAGWSAGGNVEYVVSTDGDGLAANTTTVLNPVLAVVFGRAGLKIGATLEGTKYTRIIP